MERLTQNNFDYCLEMCEPETQLDCAFYMSQTECVCGEAAIYNKLREYENAEQEGRLVVLPCKVGDTVWEIGYDCKIDYEDMCAFPAPSCGECEFVKRVIVPVRVDSVTAATFLIGKIGTTAFFSFEEAEAAMKGVSEDA